MFEIACRFGTRLREIERTPCEAERLRVGGRLLHVVGGCPQGIRRAPQGIHQQFGDAQLDAGPGVPFATIAQRFEGPQRAFGIAL